MHVAISPSGSGCGRLQSGMWADSYYRMATAMSLSDEELRRRLEELGVHPGPITDTTRALYFSKLEQEEKKNGSKRKHVSSSSDNVINAPTAKGPLATSLPRPQGAVGVFQSNKISLAQPVTEPPDPVTIQAPQRKTDPSGAVVDRQLASLNSPSHLASDTVFMFPDGEVFLASRAILSIQCSEMTPVLYSREEPFLVNIATLSGNLAQFFVRPSELVADLKEKLTLAQGIPIPEQRLVFMNNEIHNSSTISACGIVAGSTIHLVLVVSAATTHTTSYFTSALNPALSISHLSLKLGLEQLVSTQRTPLHQPPKVPLPPHIMHIVHVYDVPSDGFLLLLRYLYSGELARDTSSANALGSYVCCYVLGEYFRVPSLSFESLVCIQEVLTVENALALTRFAESIHSQTLRDTCVKFLQAHQQQ